MVDACLHLLRNPEATIDELMEIIPAPDFPTGGPSTASPASRRLPHRPRPRGDARQVPLRGHRPGQRTAIIVDEIPYQVNKKTLQERMAELVHEKKLEGISHIQDESDKSGMRLVIELKRGEVPEVVLNNLYKQTQLQDTFGINMVALIDGQPKLCNLKDLIQVFLQHRREVVAQDTCSTCARRASAATCWKAWPWRWPTSTSSSDHPRVAHPAGGQGRADEPAWDSSLVREMLTRARADGSVINADDYRPEGLEKQYGWAATACIGCRTRRPRKSCRCACSA